MFRVIESQMIVPNVHLLTFEAPAVAHQVKPGQFVIVRPDEEARESHFLSPTGIADQGTITVSLLNVGKTTGEHRRLEGRHEKYRPWSGRWATPRKSRSSEPSCASVGATESAASTRLRAR